MTHFPELWLWTLYFHVFPLKLWCTEAIWLPFGSDWLKMVMAKKAKPPRGLPKLCLVKSCAESIQPPWWDKTRGTWGNLAIIIKHLQKAILLARHMRYESIVDESIVGSTSFCALSHKMQYGEPCGQNLTSSDVLECDTLPHVMPQWWTRMSPYEFVRVFKPYDYPGCSLLFSCRKEASWQGTLRLSRDMPKSVA